MKLCCDPKVDHLDTRDAAFFSHTESICPTCRERVQGKFVFKDGKVYLIKRCLKHGEFSALISSDMNYWLKSLSYTKPGSIPKAFSTKVEKGCPDDCGLCEDHEQHTCSPLIEISNKCDLKCPICIVWNQNSYDMPYESFVKVIDGLLEKEGKLEVCYLSGGEPTLHPQFFKLAEYARSKKEINRVIISSHGLKIARDEKFAKKFAEMGLYLSLQFDSLKDENYEKIRGESLLEEKMKCLEMCEKYKIPTIFVPTLVRGFNDSEIGDIVKFALEKDFVTSVTIQPAAFTGAGGTSFPSDPLTKLNQVDVHRLLGSQVEWLKSEDFLPIPCSHPGCYTATFLLKLDDGTFVPITKIGSVDEYLDAMTNRSVLESNSKTQELIQNAIYDLWSAQSVTVDTDKVLAALKSLLIGYSKDDSKSHEKIAKNSEGKIKAIFIHAFMDEYDFEVSRVKKCCTHYVLPDGRLMPGCPYNNVHRFKDDHLNMKKIKIPERIMPAKG